MIRRSVPALCAMLLLAAALPSPASAYGYGITSFTPASSGSISFAVADIVDPSLPGSQSYMFSLQGSTGTSSGNVTVTAPHIAGTSGKTIPTAGFTAVCTALIDRAGSFSSSGTVTLGSSPVTCAHLTSNSTVNVTFEVTLYLNCGTTAAVAFPADIYSQSVAMAVTANIP